jgi:hypothetical protein
VFRYRVNATYGFYSPVTVQGFNAYGGGFGTEGRVDSGIGDHSDCPGEYSLTQHLVLAPDIRFQTINATHFSGTTGVGLNGEPAIVGRGYGNLLTIAPAVEYNFNQHIGLIALFDEQSGTGATTLAVVKKMRLPSWDAGFHIGVFAHDVGHFPSSSSDTAPRMSFPLREPGEAYFVDIQVGRQCCSSGLDIHDGPPLRYEESVDLGRRTHYIEYRE